MAVAGEGELAGQMPVRILVDDVADIVRVIAGEGAVEHDLRHRDLAALDFATRFEIDRIGETLLGLGARAGEPSRSAGVRRTLAFAGDLALRRRSRRPSASRRRARIERGALDLRIDMRPPASTVGTSSRSQGCMPPCPKPIAFPRAKIQRRLFLGCANYWTRASTTAIAVIDARRPFRRHFGFGLCERCGCGPAESGVWVTAGLSSGVPGFGAATTIGP